VTLVTSNLTSPEGLPRLTFLGGPDGIDVVWEVQSGACLISSAHAERAGRAIQLSLVRTPNPLALCAAALASTRYQFRITGLPAGSYAVQLIDDIFGQPLREVGRSSISVGAATP
jgi:hypothetical protein